MTQAASESLELKRMHSPALHELHALNVHV